LKQLLFFLLINFILTAKILLFYVIFYAALAGFFAAIFAVFYQTLDENKPKWLLDNGLIGNNPGLGFRPMPPESNVESTLVWFEAANDKNTEYWTTALDEFLQSKIYKFFFFFNFKQNQNFIKIFPFSVQEGR
jgi:Sodium / potassium ATPase beta chain